MKKVLLAVLLTTVFGFSLGCKNQDAQPAPQALQGIVSAADRGRIVSEVSAAMNSYEAAVKSLDVKKVIAHYAKEPEFRVFVDGKFLDFDSYVSQARADLSQVSRFEGGLESVTVTILGPGVAAAVAPFREIIFDKVGQRIAIKGAVTWIWVRRGSEWKILYGHATHEPDTGS